MTHDHGAQAPVSRRRLVKSRTGCTSCRARKVKCDERRPICGNCAKRYIDSQPCVYGEASVRQTPPRGGNERDTDHLRAFPVSSKIIGRGLVLEPGSMQPNNQWRSLELRLMHHYTSVVCRTMPDCNGETARDMWSRIIPQIAFDSEVVLNPMLALSALHLHAHSPDNAPMSLAISRYLDRTLVNHRNALQNYDGELTEQVWLSAVLLSNLYWLLAHQRRSDEPYQLPFHGWKMMYGVTTLFLRKHTVLRELGYEWYGHVSADTMEEHYKLSFDSAQQLKSLEDDLFGLMQGLETRLCTREVQDAYYQAQAYIVSFYRAYLCGTEPKILRMFVGTMPIKCPPLYMKLLEKHDPLAMALMARLLVLLVPIEPEWWINGIGDYEVVGRDIQGITDLMPKHLRWSMVWPGKVLSGDILLGR